MSTRHKVDYFDKLKKEVIDKGACIHCGTCVGLSSQLSIKHTSKGSIPINSSKKPITNKEIYETCPARKINYKELNEFMFGSLPKDMLLGHVKNGYVGYTRQEAIRRNGASGGVTTAVLCYLLKKKIVDAVVVLKQGEPKPWLAQPILTSDPQVVQACSQSVYVPIMANAILREIKDFKGTVACSGLPDQVAMIRQLQARGNKIAKKIKFIIGPYVGTGIYAESLATFLRSNRVKGGLEEIKDMKYREGEWPGYLRITTKSGQVFKSSKFYYNYLIPFYVTRNSLTSVDFSNELTDISIGDAWHPKYEKIGKGFSVVLSRTQIGQKILDDMKKDNLLHLKKEKYLTLLNMHAHMIDFKKRGSFIRIKWMKVLGKSVPKYDYKPSSIAYSRYFPELFISSLFFFGRMKLIRWLLEQMPLSFIGKSFNFFRKSWKKVSKSTKRKGITQVKFTFTDMDK